MALVVVLAIRLTVPVTVFRWPFWGSLLTIASDAIDVVIFQVWGFPPWGYHRTDKLLDVYYLSLEVMAAQWWLPIPRITATALYAFRMVGIGIFEVVGDRVILFMFPNVFEFFFIFGAWLVSYRPAHRLSVKGAIAWTAVLTVPKMAQEYVLHYGKLLDDYVAADIIADVWEWFRERLGIP